MLKYIGKRLLWMLPVVLGISFILFTIMDLTPGDPARVILGEYASQEDVDALREEMGLNDNFFVRYGKYIVSAVTGDLGQSYRTGVPVVEEIAARFPVTLKIAVMAMFIAVFIGIPVGIISAVRQYSFADTFSTITAILFASIPGFFLGMVLIYVFGLKLGLLPTHGIAEWRSYILPVVTLAAGGSAQLMRLTRTTMLEAIRQDFMRTAKAKGCTPACMVWKHALKNALLPVLTVMGTSFGSILGGAVICETVFAIPGLGNYILTAIRSKDIPVVMSSTVFLSAFFCLVMVVVDILYAVIDPRIREKVVK